MKRFVLYLAILALLLGMVGQAAAVPIQWSEAEGGNGHYYEKIVTTTLTWPEAQAEAETLSHAGWTGHLVTITSQEENDVVHGIVNSAPYLIYAWIGLTRAGPSDWQWVTGEDYFFSNWSVDGWPIEPLPGDTYAFIQPGGGTWKGSGYLETDYLEYVVEYEPSGEPIPEPTTIVLMGFGLLGVLGVVIMQRRKVK